MKGQNRRVFVLALTAGAIVLAPAAAEAATLDNSGGTLTYAAAPGATSVVAFDQMGATVRVTRFSVTDGNGGDNDEVTSTNGCAPVPPEPSFSAGSRFDCPGVARIVADAGDQDDQIDASGADVPGTFKGASGEDGVFGGSANDAIDGGDGDDFVGGGDGADQLIGGAGIDSTQYFASSPGPGLASPAITVTLDGQANDGRPGENDNVQTEDVSAGTFAATGAPKSAVTLVGDGQSNSLDAFGTGPADIDGGAGNDALLGSVNDDTLRARDGFADRVFCSGGNDTAIVDTLDVVSGSCENVDAANVGNAAEDRPPTVSFTTPAQGAKLGTKTPNTLTATASDDKGVAKVQFLDDDRIVCEDTTAPYTCAYSPRGDDVGRNTLVAFAIDTSQQSATAVRTVIVDRFATKVSLKVTPRKDARAPFSFRASGRVTPPSSVSKTLGCADGIVAIQVKAGRKTLSNRRVKLTRSCTFSQSVSFRSRSRFASNGKLKFTARYAGNDVLDNASSKSTTTSTR